MSNPSVFVYNLETHVVHRRSCTHGPSGAHPRRDNYEDFPETLVQIVRPAWYCTFCKPQTWSPWKRSA
jgi:hypothetical protein